MKVLKSIAMGFAFLSISFPSSANHQHRFDCTNLTVLQMKSALDSGSVSSQQCVSDFLNQIQALDPIDLPMVVSDLAGLNSFQGLNAYTSINPDALEEAIQADIQRVNGVVHKPLLGIPIAVKDNVEVAQSGFTNAAANFSLLDYQPTQDAGIVSKLKDAGAIILGQNNMHELAFGTTSINFAFGPVRNAHDPSRIAGGSSGGGATSVAARMAPAAIGNDFGGSLRIPPALNGVIGFRPSIGRYDSSGLIPFSDNVDFNDMGTNGIIARSMRDVIYLDWIIANEKSRHHKSIKKLNQLRLGVPEVYYQLLGADEKKVVDKALARLEHLGVQLIRTPDIPNINPSFSIPILGDVDNVYLAAIIRIGAIFAIQQGAWQAENSIQIVNSSPDVVASNQLLQLVLNAAELTDAASILTFYQQVLLPEVQFARANYESYFHDNHLDAIIYPTTVLTAKTISEIVDQGGNPLTNGLFDYAVTLDDGSVLPVGEAYGMNAVLSAYLGTPSLTIPIGLTERNNLPVGLQIEGLHGDDANVLEIGEVLTAYF